MRQAAAISATAWNKLAVVTRVLWDIHVLTRSPSCLGGGACTVVGVYLSGGLGAITTWRTSNLVLVVILVIASGNVVNDIVDAHLDAADKPNRPIPAGRVTIGMAWAFGGVLALTAALPRHRLTCTR
jgi:geranylgeranylglycerol-phosphate geranylgeranyltransferase